MKDKAEPSLLLWQTLLYPYHKWKDPKWEAKIKIHEDNTTAIHCVRCGNHTMKTLERNFGTKLAWMHEQVMGPKADGRDSRYCIVHTASQDMAADIYTKPFTDKRTFSNLKRLISVFTPKQIEEFDVCPAYDPDDIPQGAKDWVNLHYLFVNEGTDTSVTDMRRPIKLKTPKAKAKLGKVVVRPRKPLGPIEETDDEDDAVTSTGGDSPKDAEAVAKTKIKITDSALTRAEDKDTNETLLFMQKCSNDMARTQEPKTVGVCSGNGRDCSSKVEWTVILLCTEKDSFMRQYNPHEDQCKIVEITEEDDFRMHTGDGYEKVADALRSENCVIFASLPCTGGSPWQYLNQRKPACRRLLRKHLKLFGQLFDSLLHLFQEFRQVGTIPILFEWPRCCQYWKLPKVKKFVTMNRLSLAKFDGCAFGLRSCIQRESEKFLRKPWLVATNIPEVHRVLDGKLCPGVSLEHQHSTTCGKNSKHSQYYTVELAKSLHGALAEFHLSGNSWWKGY
jgi:hypothetical protein